VDVWEKAGKEARVIREVQLVQEMRTWASPEKLWRLGNTASVVREVQSEHSMTRLEVMEVAEVLYVPSLTWQHWGRREGGRKEGIRNKGEGEGREEGIKKKVIRRQI